ncbi:MAG TPA: pyridoxamine 5'-phosphate oxidase family protein [Ilumatobacteraceae bacterium]|nr:pyridoxamine 5'-phosphate oxidase family protein [Ilumatobacteraceae bacterium]HRB03811.1 pyridoxamine 5'-phosphate oxidase family protein [Ilumatobacteraceae bacterium]
MTDMNMTDMNMTEAERSEFLAAVRIGVLAVEHPGHGPLALPIWYQWEDGVVLISMSGRSLKARLLRAAGRATMTVQTETPPYSYVSVEGPVVVAGESRDNLAMATRYLGPELGKWYADTNPSDEDTVVVRLTPEKWRTCDFGKGMA